MDKVCRKALRWCWMYQLQRRALWHFKRNELANSRIMVFTLATHS